MIIYSKEKTKHDMILTLTQDISLYIICIYISYFVLTILTSYHMIE